MLEQWLEEKASETAARLTEITDHATGEEGLSGYGMKSKVQRLIYLLRCAMYPKLYQEKQFQPARMQAAVAEQLRQAAELLAELRLQGLTKAAGADLEAHAYAVNDRVKDAALRNLHILAAV